MCDGNQIEQKLFVLSPRKVKRSIRNLTASVRFQLVPGTKNADVAVFQAVGVR